MFRGLKYKNPLIFVNPFFVLLHKKETMGVKEFDTNFCFSNLNIPLWYFFVEINHVNIAN